MQNQVQHFQVNIFDLLKGKFLNQPNEKDNQRQSQLTFRSQNNLDRPVQEYNNQIDLLEKIRRTPNITPRYQSEEKGEHRSSSLHQCNNQSRKITEQYEMFKNRFSKEKKKQQLQVQPSPKWNILNNQQIKINRNNNETINSQRNQLSAQGLTQLQKSQRYQKITYAQSNRGQNQLLEDDSQPSFHSKKIKSSINLEIIKSENISPKKSRFSNPNNCPTFVINEESTISNDNIRNNSKQEQESEFNANLSGFSTHITSHFSNNSSGITQTQPKRCSSSLVSPRNKSSFYHENNQLNTQMNGGKQTLQGNSNTLYSSKKKIEKNNITKIDKRGSTLHSVLQSIPCKNSIFIPNYQIQGSSLQNDLAKKLRLLQKNNSNNNSNNNSDSNISEQQKQQQESNNNNIQQQTQNKVQFQQPEDTSSPNFPSNSQVIQTANMHNAQKENGNNNYNYNNFTQGSSENLIPVKSIIKRSSLKTSRTNSSEKVLYRAKSVRNVMQNSQQQSQNLNSSNNCPIPMNSSGKSNFLSNSFQQNFGGFFTSLNNSQMQQRLSTSSFQPLNNSNQQNLFMNTSNISSFPQYSNHCFSINNNNNNSNNNSNCNVVNQKNQYLGDNLTSTPSFQQNQAKNNNIPLQNIFGTTPYGMISKQFMSKSQNTNMSMNSSLAVNKKLLRKQQSVQITNDMQNNLHNSNCNNINQNQFNNNFFNQVNSNSNSNNNSNNYNQPLQKEQQTQLRIVGLNQLSNNNNIDQYQNQNQAIWQQQQQNPVSKEDLNLFDVLKEGEISGNNTPYKSGAQFQLNNSGFSNFSNQMGELQPINNFSNKNLQFLELEESLTPINAQSQQQQQPNQYEQINFQYQVLKDPLPPIIEEQKRKLPRSRGSGERIQFQSVGNIPLSESSYSQQTNSYTMNGSKKNLDPPILQQRSKSAQLLECEIEHLPSSNSNSDFSSESDQNSEDKIVDISMHQSQLKNPLESTMINKHINDTGFKKINNYTVIKEIGRGKQGKVKLGLDDNEKKVAIKIVNKYKLKKSSFAKNSNEVAQLEKELEILKKLRHPNIVQLTEVIDDPEKNKIYMIFEYMEQGAIQSVQYFGYQKRQYMKRQSKKDLMGSSSQTQKKYKYDTEITDNKIPQEKAQKYYKDLALALDYMHNYMHVVHRDIKPPNLLIDKHDILKVGDFGVSYLMEQMKEKSQPGQVAGSWAFFAPECWQKDAEKGYPIDIWAAGITLYKLIFGIMPFKAKDKFELKKKIIGQEIEFPDEGNYDPNLIDFMKKCLDRNQTTRIKASEWLVHPWINENPNKVLKNQLMVLDNFNMYDNQNNDEKHNAYILQSLTDKDKKQLRGSFYAAAQFKAKLIRLRKKKNQKPEQIRIKIHKSTFIPLTPKVPNKQSFDQNQQKQQLSNTSNKIDNINNVSFKSNNSNTQTKQLNKFSPQISMKVFQQLN